MHSDGVFLAVFLLFAKQIEYNFIFFLHKKVFNFVSYNSGVIVLVISNRPSSHHSYDYSLNCTTLRPITLSNFVFGYKPNYIIVIRAFLQRSNTEYKVVILF